MLITYKNETTTRLDKYLVEQYPNTSRSQIQKAIKNGEILVNGKESTVHHFLKNGDEIEIKIDLNNVETRHALSPKPNKKIKLNIITETDNYIVLNKPAGLLVHPTEKNEPDTLVNGLLAYYPEIENVGDETINGNQSQRPGIVHRLDRNVSGIMIVAKTQPIFEHLKKQFQDRTIKKEYIALVHGEMENPNGTIDFPIGKNKETGKMAARPKIEAKTESDSEASESDSVSVRQQSKSAITSYEVKKQFQHYALLKVQIKTGRTHQIRVHLNALGHPVVGDETYKPRNLHTRVKLDRIFLHAQTLGFNNLNGEWREFDCNLPEQLDSFLKNLK